MRATAASAQWRPTNPANGAVSCYVVDNGTGRPGGLRAAIYARLEETSFRSGAAVGAAAVGATGVVIAVMVTLGGHPVAQAQARPAESVPSSVASPAPAPDPPSVPARPSPAVSAPASNAAASGNAPAPDYLPAARVTPAATEAPARPLRLRPGDRWFWGPPPGSWPWRWPRPPWPRR
jgi:hypothetical protein